MIVDAIAKVRRLEDLTASQAEAVMDEIMTGRCQPAQFGAFVTALGMKGETASEVAGMARSMRRAALPLPLAATDFIDTCGTGGDGLNTFNISTAAAFVAAGAGVVVAKHGNRAASSKSGSADVLEALGADITLSPERVANCIDEAGIGFLFAQSFHPAMRFAGPLRAQIQIPTVFNILGPLTNPARAPRQLLGVARAELLDLVAGALAQLETRRALVVHGADGLDELSIAGPSKVVVVDNGTINHLVVRPSQLGLTESPLESVAGGSPQENAAIISGVLDGRPGPARDIVALNGGAALFAAGRTDDLAGGLALAIESIDSGRARERLDRFVSVTRST